MLTVELKLESVGEIQVRCFTDASLSHMSQNTPTTQILDQAVFLMLHRLKLISAVYLE